MSETRSSLARAGEQATISETPIACTLNVGDYKERFAQIAELARDALRGYEREGLLLRLRYEATAADLVKENGSTSLLILSGQPRFEGR
jgi:hypothetical protein